MAAGTVRNFGIAQRERERRLGGLLDDPYDATAIDALADPAGNAFWGSLNEQAALAQANGLGYRVGFDGLGRGPGRLPLSVGAFGGDGGGDDLTARSIAINDYLSRTPTAGQRDLAVRAAASDVQRRETAAREAERAYNDESETRRLADQMRINQPITKLSDRDVLLRSVPPTVRPQIEKLYSDLDLADRQQTVREETLDETIRSNKENEAIQRDGTLSGDALDNAARMYLKTGEMPTLGMRDPNNRQRILNRAAQLGGQVDIAGNKAGYKADAGSLTAMQKQRDAISAFENTTMKNIDVFLETAGKVVDTGSPLANSAARVISGKMLGSPDQAAYDTARQVAINEIAKIVTNPNLSGVLSDSARHEVEAFNPRNATLAQTVAVMRLLKQDMKNRTVALDDQLKQIRGRISQGSQPPPAGTVKMSSPDGSEQFDVPADQVDHYLGRGAKKVGG